MRMKIHQRRVARKIVICGVNTEVGISDGRTRHIQRVNNFLKVRGGAIGGDLIGKNGGKFDEEKKSKMHYLFNQRNQQIT